MARLYCALILLVSCLSTGARAQTPAPAETLGAGQPLTGTGAAASAAQPEPGAAVNNPQAAAPDAQAAGQPAAVPQATASEAQAAGQPAPVPQATAPQAPSAQPGAQAAPSPQGPPQPAPAKDDKGKKKSFVDRLPFLPVPEIDIDPNSGTTLGLIPTILRTDDQGAIREIIAPDIVYNPYFGAGARARAYGFPSEDTQWQLIGGGKQRVESEFDAMIDTGRLRNKRWSFIFEAAYDRNGTPRFYGFGNDSTIFNQSVYTNQQLYARVIAGYNFTHEWQLAYQFEPRKIKIVGASLSGIPSLTQKLDDLGFQGLLGLGVTHEMLNRVILTYDTRDDIVVPQNGKYIRTYGGLASRNGLPDDSLFSEAGVDANEYWTPANGNATWAGHVGLRFMPTTRRTPFYALSSLGGDDLEIGESEPLRGYGAGRFYDRESLVFNLEYRRHILNTELGGTAVDVQLVPFADAGRVYHNPGTFPLEHLHPVAGLGIRAVARPSVVGYLDLGMGGEGLAVFTGLNYPF